MTLVVMLLGGATYVLAGDEPWLITDTVVLTEPTDLGHVIVLSGGSLTVRDLPEPGLRMSGHIWAIGTGEVRLERSVIQFMSVYHGQFSLVGAEEATIEVMDCDYRVPNGVQHALMVAGNAQMVVEDTDFGNVQLLSANDATFEARRLTGHFEVLVQHDSTMVLEDIPRIPEEGKIWVWVEFPNGSDAEYTPPLSPPPGSVTLVGSIAQFSLDPDVAAGTWRFEAAGRDGGPSTMIGEGSENIEDDVLGIWSGANPALDYRLQSTLTDGLGRTLVGNHVVPGSGPRVR